jgi:phage FluMu protein Com
MIEINGEKYRELRCSKCRKLICYENVRGKLCYLCPRCGEHNFFNFTELREWKKSDRIKVLEFIKKKEGE